MQIGPHIFSVREITRYIKTTLERESPLQALTVRGEISNCKYHSSGHLYFTLKDEFSQLPCVMWADRVRAQRFVCENGMRVMAEGNVTVYERGGNYQLSVYNLQADGVGNLFLAFEQLKSKLAGEGLFDAQRKRRLPAIPHRVALLSSPTGAVVHDFLNVGTRRWRGRHIIFIPIAVQGANAPASIVHGLSLASRLPDLDVIVVARGGGSFEELSAFNDEAVARAIANSPIPVVSAIGHETDFTIADFVSDLRAPTPSAAAELVIPDLQGIDGYLNGMQTRLLARMRQLVERSRRDVSLITSYPEFRDPRQIIRQRQQDIDLLAEQITGRMKARLKEVGHTLAALEIRMNALDPRGVLQRGYAIVRDEEGKVITSSADANREPIIHVRFSDGETRATPLPSP